MGIGPYHHSARESVVLQYGLVDYAGAGFPEAYPIAGCCGLEEGIDFFVSRLCSFKIGRGTVAGAYQVVAVDGCGHAHTVAAGRHELQQRHLCRRILHGNAVRTEGSEIFKAAEGAEVFLVENMGVNNLLRKRQRPSQRFARGGHPFTVSSIEGPYKIRVEHNY